MSVTEKIDESATEKSGSVKEEIVERMKLIKKGRQKFLSSQSGGVMGNGLLVELKDKHEGKKKRNSIKQLAEVTTNIKERKLNKKESRKSPVEEIKRAAVVVNETNPDGKKIQVRSDSPGIDLSIFEPRGKRKCVIQNEEKKSTKEDEWWSDGEKEGVPNNKEEGEEVNNEHNGDEAVQDKGRQKPNKSRSRKRRKPKPAVPAVVSPQETTDAPPLPSLHEGETYKCYVFSTAMANRAGYAVDKGLFPSIGDYHAAQEWDMPYLNAEVHCRPFNAALEDQERADKLAAKKQKFFDIAESLPSPAKSSKRDEEKPTLNCGDTNGFTNGDLKSEISDVDDEKRKQIEAAEQMSRLAGCLTGEIQPKVEEKPQVLKDEKPVVPAMFKTEERVAPLRTDSPRSNGRVDSPRIHETMKSSPNPTTSAAAIKTNGHHYPAASFAERFNPSSVYETRPSVISAPSDENGMSMSESPRLAQRQQQPPPRTSLPMEIPRSKEAPHNTALPPPTSTKEEQQQVYNKQPIHPRDIHHSAFMSLHSPHLQFYQRDFRGAPGIHGGRFSPPTSSLHITPSTVHIPSSMHSPRGAFERHVPRTAVPGFPHHAKQMHSPNTSSSLREYTLTEKYSMLAAQFPHRHQRPNERPSSLPLATEQRGPQHHHQQQKKKSFSVESLTSISSSDSVEGSNKKQEISSRIPSSFQQHKKTADRHQQERLHREEFERLHQQDRLERRQSPVTSASHDPHYKDPSMHHKDPSAMHHKELHKDPMANPSSQPHHKHFPERMHDSSRPPIHVPANLNGLKRSLDERYIERQHSKKHFYEPGLDRFFPDNKDHFAERFFDNERFEKERLAMMEKKTTLGLLDKERFAHEKDRLALHEKDRLALHDKERMALLETKERYDKERLQLMEKERLSLMDKDRLSLLDKERLALIDKERLSLLDKERLAFRHHEQMRQHVAFSQQQLPARSLPAELYNPAFHHRHFSPSHYASR